ncbi:hypothetical protein NPIL_204351 [Nephila pilipes]|uniref:Uncharacterized protein n=1 Tax=Nephila pilipes TaxID=299642 RepID=A0A8X6P8N6_NEPPI|nr:hypothetical protein NPIL_204351 [Nephila pilipes]
MGEATIKKMQGRAKSDLTRFINCFSEHLRKFNLSCDDIIVNPHASSPDNSNGKSFDLHSAYNDESQIRRPAKRRHPNRALDSSKNENSRGAEPAPIPSLPERALCFQNPRVIGQSSSHETTDMPAQQNFSKGVSASGCLLSSSGASASCGNTSIADVPFKLCPRFTTFGIEQTVSTTSVAASRNGGAAFERTIDLLKQFNLEPDPD